MVVPINAIQSQVALTDRPHGIEKLFVTKSSSISLLELVVIMGSLSFIAGIVYFAARNILNMITLH
ncbi:hypothetical protein MJH12_14895 [bacterium]|nr:hypothetical protein [bacterium]